MTSLAARQESAVDNPARALAALEDHAQSYVRDLNRHRDGIAAIASLKLFEHLRLAVGRGPVPKEAA
ncbi:MAG: hypothetical protein ACRD96_00785, partial [Bryobacteraceae bacterium]